MLLNLIKKLCNFNANFAVLHPLYLDRYVVDAVRLDVQVVLVADDRVALKVEGAPHAARRRPRSPRRLQRTSPGHFSLHSEGLRVDLGGVLGLGGSLL